MNRLSLHIITSFCLLLFSFLNVSCNKDNNQSYTIEGTWGLVYYNVTLQAGNELISNKQGDCDPFNPTGEMNAKYSFINTNDNTYLLTEFSWNDKKKEWQFADKGTFRMNGNVLTLVSLDNEKNEITGTNIITIKTLTEDTAVFEKSSTDVIDGVTYKLFGTYNIRRMNSL